jgi:AcrR family transcriptional regulator
MNKFELKRIQSIAHIREAALRLFAENGYEKTTIRLIAQQANMAIGLLYNYYSSKEDLLKDIYRSWQQQLRLTLQPDGDGLQRNDVESYIRQTIRMVKANRPLWKLIYGIRMQSAIIQQLEAEMKTEQQQVQHQIAAYLVHAGIAFPGLEAKLLFATLDGLVQHYLQQDSFPIDDIGNLLILKYRNQAASAGLI